MSFNCDVDYDPIMNKCDMILEPKWKSWIVETTTPLFTPKQCQMIIDEAIEDNHHKKAQVGMGKTLRWSRY